MRVLELGVRGTRPWEEEEVDVEHGWTWVWEAGPADTALSGAGP